MVLCPELGLPQSREPVDIEEWTEAASRALGSLSIDPPRSKATRCQSVTLDIPLDVHDDQRKASEDAQPSDPRPPTPRRREPIRRDSLKRREALLRGKEGSRRRQRWENGRLMGNPYMEPPLPTDWEIRPTYPVYSVPYFLASQWDDNMANNYNSGLQRSKPKAVAVCDEASSSLGNVEKDVREKLKRARGAKGLLQDLEDQVRSFVESWDERQQEKENTHASTADPDSDTDELVFVGRDGSMHDTSDSRRASQELARQRLVFDSPATDHGASFGRWLVHSLGAYYGLETWSVTTGDPARREAYVGIKESRLKAGRASARSTLPRPLYGLV